MEITALQEKVQTKEAQAEEASNQSVALRQQLQDNQQEVTRCVLSSIAGSNSSVDVSSLYALYWIICLIFFKIIHQD